jgi:hypothetical protein
MSSPALESFLAKLYTDDRARARFLEDMRGEAERAGLSEADAAALSEIDRTGLQMAAASYAHKRARHRAPRLRLAQAVVGWMRSAVRSRG